MRKWIDIDSLRLTVVSIAAAGGLFLSAMPGRTEIPLYGPSGISPGAVKQGTLGSCYFHASVAAVAKANPSAIRSAITGNHQAGYRVRFVTAPEELVYAQDLDYAHAHNYDHSDGEWVAVLMRGYAQRELRESLIDSVSRSTTIPTFVKPATLAVLKQSGPLLIAYDRAVRGVVTQDGQMDKGAFRIQLTRELNSLGVPSAQSATIAGLIEHAGVYESLAKTVQANGEVFGAYRGMGQGGIAVSVISAILGTASSGQVSDESLLVGKLRVLHHGGEAMVAGTKSSGPESGDSSNWFVANHAYTVLDFDENRGIVSLRNPWAAKPGPNGFFEVNLSIFERAYSTFSYSK